MVKDRVRVVTKHEPSEELNAWAESLHESQIDYLMAQARDDLSSEQQNHSAFDSRIVAVVGWAIVGVGTLLIAGDLEFDLAARGVSAMMVVIGASIAVLAGIFTLWPREWASGLDLEWYSQYDWDELQQMKARGLASLIHGSRLNQQVIRRRNYGLQLAAVGLLVEFAALVATLLLPAPGG